MLLFMYKIYTNKEKKEPRMMKNFESIVGVHTDSFKELAKRARFFVMAKNIK